jgi:hypothetical protein
MRDRRHVRRLFEDIEEAVGDRLAATLRQDSTARPRASGARRSSRSPTRWTRCSSNGTPGGPLAAAPYDRLLGECCAYVIELACDLPAFHAGAFTEILQRQPQILQAIRLHRVPSVTATTRDARSPPDTATR